MKDSSMDSKCFYFGKAVDYSKYRPDYPIELFELLKKEYNLNENETYYEEFMNGVKGIFDKYSKNGYVTFDFNAEMFIREI